MRSRTPIKLLLSIWLVMSLNIANAQPYWNCTQVAQAMMKALENDYVEGDRLSSNWQYQQLKSRVNSGVLGIELDDTCLLTLHSIVESLQDGHISPRLFLDRVILKRAVDTPVLDKIYYNLVHSKRRNKDISGLWELLGGNIRYIVIKDSVVKNKFNVLVWSSANRIMRKGFLKGAIFRIRKDSFVYKNILDTNMVAPFALKARGKDRLYNAITGEWQRKADFTSVIEPLGQLMPEMKRLNANTFYIRFPSFMPNYRAPMDSLLSIYHDSLMHAEHLIIDIRDNTGGSRLTYNRLLKYIYDKPIRIDGAYYMASVENVKKLRASMLRFGAAGDSGMFRAFKENADRLEANMGRKVLDSGYFINYDTIYANPKRVSLIINNRTASAGELLLMSAKQSGKVTVFGESSAGVIDRADAYLSDCGCKNLGITIPISLRKPEGYLKPVDNIGIPPDVPIKKIKNWVQYVQQYYMNE
jgi:hypothetical protein